MVILVTILLTLWCVFGGAYALLVILGGRNKDVWKLLLCGPVGWALLFALGLR